MSAPTFVTVADVATVDSGPAFKSAYFGDSGFGIRLLRGDNIEPGSLRWTRTKTWPDELLNGYEHLAVREGDLILGMDRPVISTGLKLARVTKADLPALLVQRVARIRPANIDQRYLYQCLTSQEFIRHLQGSATGTQLPHVTLTSIREFRVPRFGDETERRIVDLLEDHLSRLDAAETYLQAAARRLDVIVTSILCGLIPDVSFYAANWERRTVADVGTVGLGRQRHPDWHTGPNMKRYLRVANIFEDRIDTSDVMEMHWPGEIFDRFRLYPGDILLNEGQTPDLLGRPAIYRGAPTDVAFTNSLLRFKAGPDVLPEFALLVFRRHMRVGRFKRESRITTNIAHLSANRFKQVEFPVPPRAEQVAIVEQAERRFSAVERLRSELRMARIRQGNLRRSIFAAAFSGRLTSTTPAVSEAAETITA